MEITKMDCLHFAFVGALALLEMSLVWVVTVWGYVLNKRSVS